MFISKWRFPCRCRHHWWSSWMAEEMARDYWAMSERRRKQLQQSDHKWNLKSWCSKERKEKRNASETPRKFTYPSQLVVCYQCVNSSTRYSNCGKDKAHRNGNTCSENNKEDRYTKRGKRHLSVTYWGPLKKDDNVNGLTRIRFLECYVLSSFHFCKPIYDRSTLVWRTLAIRRKIKEADRLQHDFLKRKSLSINVCLCFDVI